MAVLSGTHSKFTHQQSGLGDAQPANHKADQQGKPQDNMQPPRRLKGELKPDGEDGDEAADAQREEGSRAITHVEGRKVEAANTAAGREHGHAVKQRARAAAGAKTEKGSLAKSGLPLWFVGLFRHLAVDQWIGAPQPPQT